MSSTEDEVCEDEDEQNGKKDLQGGGGRSSWDRCVLGSVLSISAGVILGSVGTVVLASEVPVLVGTGVGVSMAAAYCGKTFRGSKGSKSGHEPTGTQESDDDLDEDDDDVCQCFMDDDDDEVKEQGNNSGEKPCSMEQDINGLKCTCTCTPIEDPPAC